MFSIIALGVLGCGDVPPLQDQFQKLELAMPLEERLRIEAAAPIIVLGTIVEVSRAGKPRMSLGDPRIMTQLTKITVALEQVIKGHIESNRLIFYFFIYSSDNRRELGTPIYVPKIGQRRIFFLKPWKNDYRAVGDVTNYSLPVRSGTHVKPEFRS